MQEDLETHGQDQINQTQNSLLMTMDWMVTKNTVINQEKTQSWQPENLLGQALISEPLSHKNVGSY